jgi:uncharacterized surface protein with fasciclin (FAS1) repeats
MRICQLIMVLVAVFTFNVVQAAETKDIVQVLRGNSNYSTLVNLLVQADLISTLEGNGPYTLFAPTNAAFAKLPPQVLQDLNKPENKDKLVAIIKYHVIPKSLSAYAIQTGSSKTLSGKDLDLRVQGAEIIVNGNARIVKPDIVAGNGVIHVVDTVLIPKN